MSAEHSADVCTAALQRISEREAVCSGRGYGSLIPEKGLACRVLHLLGCACIALVLPCGQEALAAQEGQALHKAIELRFANAAVEARAAALADQPFTDRLRRLVEFLSAVPPECRAVPHQQADKECEQGKKGVLQQFKHDHPIMFGLLSAALTFLAGFTIGGGFGGGK